ncbi:MAG TPA: ABC transporter permease [Longimicrobiales bacterium]
MNKIQIPLMRLESLKEGVHLALDQLRANKFRSALTILGIVVGVASVMAMSAMVTGIRSGIMSDLEAAGPKNFFFSRYDWNEVRISDDGPPWGNNPEVTVAEVLSLRRLPGIKDAIPGVDGSVVMEFGRERMANVQVPGRGSGWTNYTGGRMIRGHDFLPSDVLSAAPVTVVSSELAAKLFGPLDPVGRMVRMNGQAFRVIGVFEPAPNIFASIMKHFAVVPYTAALKHLDFDDEMIVGLIVTAPNATQDEAMDQVAAYVRTSRGVHPSEGNNFALIRQEEMARTFNRITGIFFMIMIALSSVALMVGGVGVIAIMMIAVTERTREIGIRKALGATQREILWQFLFESVTVTFIGGVIGMIIGGSLAFIVSVLTPIDAQVPIGGIVAALGMATVAGVLFGLWPAWRAARLDPVVALRYE